MLEPKGPVRDPKVGLNCCFLVMFSKMADSIWGILSVEGGRDNYHVKELYGKIQNKKIDSYGCPVLVEIGQRQGTLGKQQKNFEQSLRSGFGSIAVIYLIFERYNDICYL